MNNIISMDVMVGIIKEQFAAGGKKVEFTPKGISMLPMLRNNKDVIVLEKCDAPLKKYDLPLYRRENGRYVLHRVVDVSDDGTYVMCGDNQTCREKGIKHEQIIGVVTGFVKNGKRHECSDWDYRLYCRFWVGIMPIRHVLYRVRRFLGRVKRKINRIIVKRNER